MSLTVQRMNGDATLVVEGDGTALLLDPWLVGGEVDFAPWFHEAWHVEPVIAPERLPRLDAVIVSQAYGDHNHADTLRALPAELPAYAVPDAVGSVAAARSGGVVTAIPEGADGAVRIGALRVWRTTRPWWHPPRYHALVIADDREHAVVFAPHGLPVEAARAIAARVTVDLLATTRLHYQLPFFLGGAVNPGPEAAEAAREACRARHALAIHDEPKREVGLVARLARTRRVAATDAWVTLAVGVPLQLEG